MLSTRHLTFDKTDVELNNMFYVERFTVNSTGGEKFAFIMTAALSTEIICASDGQPQDRNFGVSLGGHC